MAKTNWHMSATFIAAFKACAMRAYYKYVHGIVPDEDSDALRTGTNWHAILEIMGMEPGTECPNLKNAKFHDGSCALCEGTGTLPDDIMDAVIRTLNAAYDEVPVYKTREEWLTERAILLYTVAGYNWRWADDDLEVVATEIPFELELHDADGKVIPNVIIPGKIDKLLRNKHGKLFVGEHKSTGKAIDSGSSYWSHLTMDTQTTLYIYAARKLQQSGKLVEYGIFPDDDLISAVYYDVWHKPQTRPKKLTQAESKKFCETDGEYMGKKFNVTGSVGDEEDLLRVDGEVADIEPGAEPKAKKDGTTAPRPFAIRETPDMYGQRLLQDISNEPDKYFFRKELSKTDADLAKFERELLGIYKTVVNLEEINGWWSDETQCEATFKCPYTSFCYNNITLAEDEVPDGFKRTYKKVEDEIPF